MHVVQPKKKESMTLTIHAPKTRGMKVPQGQVFKDKRRKARVNNRADFRKDID